MLGVAISQIFARRPLYFGCWACGRGSGKSCHHGWSNMRNFRIGKMGDPRKQLGEPYRAQSGGIDQQEKLPGAAEGSVGWFSSLPMI
eukprot:273606-Amphidinium_carterae.2